ncbi:MAG: hypothetical protein EAZ32_07460 [Cytophagia bacterium]|nr:MAG: hypothetical protein EAZ46_04390 [Runella sp.]TAG19631.1 MAG: hypothetical protein EAZ38_12025 [Cytophagales bacterium]TAG40208.1 MAG: hypothetical protein EAZ32_07460 [Cytophagia bacterium]TAG80425.1 MAG: hypothetical protein EAZ22_09445 [Cytophagales bacterium]
MKKVRIELDGKKRSFTQNYTNQAEIKIIAAKPNFINEKAPYFTFLYLLKMDFKKKMLKLSKNHQ